MDRRTLLTSVAVGAAVGVGAGLGTVQLGGRSAITTQGPAAAMINRGRTRELLMVTSWPRNMPGLGESADYLAKLIGDMTGGAIRIEVATAGERVPPFGVFDAVSLGRADMYHAADYYWTGKSPAYPFFTAVPFGLSTQEMLGWIDHGGGQALWNELSAQFNIVPFPAATTGVQMGGWFKREVRGLDDFRGLKMRIPGMGGDVIRALGGSAVAIPGGEIFGALQSGLIDATEWVGPWNDYQLGFYRVAPYYYGPGFHEPGPILACGINRQVWESLPSDQQAIVRAACHAANHWSIGAFHWKSAEYLKILLDDHGVQLRQFPQDVIRRAYEASNDILATIANNDGLSRRIYESFDTARRTLPSWSNVADGGYFNMRNAAAG
ncbi:MAG: TRAP transporter substrate-binding protein [Caulobacterales bacterium]|jgi:TRAP-type mannitol/chloroaromatic compound transport system substrate-binding protein